MIRTFVLILMSCCAFLQLLPSAAAHELRPGYLELRETVRANMFDVLWKVPVRSQGRLALYVRLPPNCSAGEKTYSRDGNAVVERWQAACEGGLSNRLISIDGLNATLTDVLVRLERLDGSKQIARLTPEQPNFAVSSAEDGLTVISIYFMLGVEHILAGVDHLLFVLALLLIVSGWRRMLATITSFTIAHSITLAAATLGYIWLPSLPVEAVIALSIMFLASELIRINDGEISLTARYPWVIAFIFGLLHGLGFAGALAEVGLPQTEIPLALLMFNVGVEAGQIMFVAAVLGTKWCLKQWQFEWPRWSMPAAAYGIGCVSAFWFVERIAGFL